jgi:hypothetical protein
MTGNKTLMREVGRVRRKGVALQNLVVCLLVICVFRVQDSLQETPNDVDGKAFDQWFLA